jgi:MobA-like NTP transferase domain
MAVAETPLVVLAAGRARRFGGIKPLAPVGPDGQAVIDLGASDAYDAGFTKVVIVVNPETGPVIEEHIHATWPSDAPVEFAVQAEPRGTVDAVNAARGVVDTRRPFSVVNADDLYGAAALRIAHDALDQGLGNLLVGFELHRAISGSDPVTRGVCDVIDGTLHSISERRNVVREGDRFVTDDGLEPVELPGSTIVSMNLWGFEATFWDVFDWVMARSNDASVYNEVLLPELVGKIIRGELAEAFPTLAPFRVPTTSAACIGVTHPDDLALVQVQVADQIRHGERSATLFSSLPYR